MIIIGSILIWVAFCYVNVLFAKWNVAIVNNRKKAGNKKQINHFIWGAFYCTLSGIVWFIIPNLYLIGAILPLHISIFPVLYNRGTGVTDFHLSETSTAITDRIMVWLRLKDTKEVNISALLLSVALLIKSIA